MVVARDNSGHQRGYLRLITIQHATRPRLDNGARWRQLVSAYRRLPAATGPAAAAAWVPDLIPDGFRRAAQATVVYHPCSVNSMLPLGSTCNTRTSGASALDVAVVAEAIALTATRQLLWPWAHGNNYAMTMAMDRTTR